ncbi:uncharacterized protein zgc:194930 [Triplophysa rosa]|uniref:Uncharacterized protein n=1 Tax=Triplophysa rosa TaxID=992332 RepID=A0A9W8CCA8_TRIRA|nr:uncharacterized protein zgc:194930 [Triplophysa rosa]XP_057195583.1 uncharacterized protein zgc:194930 [Triplophysa rosa]KAI7814960.1 hypothetical protein IRJ41_024298 [Triplophysa rosa]
MGCSCCRMVKGYISDASVPVDVPGCKRDPTTSSLYQSHKFPEESDHIHKKQGFHNLGYSTHPSPTKLDIDNNHINRLHANVPDQRVRPSQPEHDSRRYILRPEDEGTPVKTLCDEPMLGTEPGKREERFRDSGLGSGGISEGSDGCPCGQEEEYEEMRCRVASTPDTESMLSVDMHTSSTSLSSADTKLVIDDRDENEPAFIEEEQETEKESDGLSITDSMVAEALAALDAATAGEDFE